MRRRQYFTSAALFPTVVGVVVAGAFAGALTVNNISDASYQEMVVNFNNFLDNVMTGSTNQSSTLFESMLKYGKFAIIIWLAGFFTVGIAITIISIFSYGFVYGFTTGFIVRLLGLPGLGFACAGYLLQNIVLMPAFVFISVFSLRFALDRLGVFHYAKLQKEQRNKEYLLAFAICIACVMLAASIEAFISDGLMQEVSYLLLKD